MEKDFTGTTEAWCTLYSKYLCHYQNNGENADREVRIAELNVASEGAILQIQHAFYVKCGSHNSTDTLDFIMTGLEAIKSDFKTSPKSSNRVDVSDFWGETLNKKISCDYGLCGEELVYAQGLICQQLITKSSVKKNKQDRVTTINGLEYLADYQIEPFYQAARLARTAYRGIEFRELWSVVGAK
jgi:hypothetical protein